MARISVLRAAIVMAVIAFFSCSRSPLDPSTELGDRVVTDYDRDALDFGKNFSIVIDSLAVDSVFSFSYDMSGILAGRTDSLKEDSADIAEDLFRDTYSGLHRSVDSLSAGERGGEYAVAYLEFDLESIRSSKEDHKKLDYCLDSLRKVVLRIPVNPASIEETGKQSGSGSSADSTWSAEWARFHLLAGEPKSRGERVDTTGWTELSLRYREGKAELEATMDTAWVRSLNDSLKSFLDSAYDKEHLRRAFAIAVDSGLVRLPLNARKKPRLILSFNSDTTLISSDDANAGGCRNRSYTDSLSYTHADYSGFMVNGEATGVDKAPTSSWISRSIAVFEVDLDPFYEIVDRKNVGFALSAHLRIGVRRGRIDYERDSLPFVFSFQDQVDLRESLPKSEFEPGVFVPRRGGQFEIPVTDYINELLERGYRGPAFLLIGLLSEEAVWGSIRWNDPEKMKFEALVVPSAGGGL